ncbi:hypothetical protein [Desulfonatronum sp. SC1]|uniref:hypothetical protein n=1 Tax=Desulfonatronum sp. SC1 TaxID=2109626 RepID=UPI0011B24AF5|nr:hypothetical protein [Desulfonatronum sp. SC1]
MKTLVVFLLIFMVVCEIQAEPARGQNHQVVHIGVSDRTFPAANRNDALAALKVWASMVFDSLNIQEH